MIFGISVHSKISIFKFCSGLRLSLCTEIIAKIDMAMARYKGRYDLHFNNLLFSSRQIHDSTDHMWTEVYSEKQRRWVHVDPCEAKVDAPLLYESGWGKKLAYVVAVSKDEVVDVSSRYATQPKVLASRRDR